MTPPRVAPTITLGAAGLGAFIAATTLTDKLVLFGARLVTLAGDGKEIA